MAEDVKVTVPGIGPRHVRVVAGPEGDPLSHTRVLNKDPLDVDDGSGPLEAVTKAVVVVAPDQVDATVQANLDGGGILQAALVGKITKVPNDVVGSDSLVPGGDQGLVMCLDGLERSRSGHAGTEHALVPKMGVSRQQGSWHFSLQNNGGLLALRGAPRSGVKVQVPGFHRSSAPVGR